MACLTLAAASLVTAGPAYANGRFPAAQAIESVPGDGATLFLRATFGILVSRDAGKTWRWICERALGYDGTWDPPIAVTRDGRLWVGLEHGLVSTLDGCTVDAAAELADEGIRDLTTDARGETLWALTGGPGRRAAVWRRTPRGAWERTGLLPEGFNPSTIEVAPSRPSRVYVSGQPFETIRGWLLRSDDGGKTFVGGKNDLAADGPFFIAAVDPKEPDRVLVRHLHTTGSAVLLTKDGGKTFTSVLAMNSAMYGFAKTEGGTTYYAASGLATDGIFASKDRGEHFERVSEHGVLCLHAAAGGRLFVCENPLAIGASAIAMSSDEGKTITSLAKFGDIQGAVTCGADHADAGGLCTAASWAETYALITPRDGGVTRVGARRMRDGGARVRDAEADASGAQAPSDGSGSKCGCTVPGARRGSAECSGGIAIALLAVVISRRRLSGPSRPT